MGFWESVGFAALMTLWDTNKKQQKEDNKSKYINQRQVAFTTVAENAFNKMTVLMEKKNIMPQTLFEGSKLFVLYPAMQVIYNQGYVGKAQEDVLKLFFQRMDYGFSYHSFVQDSISKGNSYDKVMALLEVKVSNIGSTWAEFMRLLIKEENATRILQYFAEQYNSAIVSFSSIEDTDNEYVLSLCKDFGKTLEIHFEKAKEDRISLTALDYYNNATAKEYFQKITDLFYDFVDKSGTREELEDVESVYKYAMGNYFYKFVFSSKHPEELKRKILYYVFELIGLDVLVSADEVLFMKEDEFGPGQQVLTAVSEDSMEQPSVFTIMITKMEHVVEKKLVGSFIMGLANCMKQLECEIETRWPGNGFDKYAERFAIEKIEYIEKQRALANP